MSGSVEPSPAALIRAAIDFSNPDIPIRKGLRKQPMGNADTMGECRDSFAFASGNGREQMSGSVEPSPAALIRAAFDFSNPD